MRGEGKGNDGEDSAGSGGGERGDMTWERKRIMAVGITLPTVWQEEQTKRDRQGAKTEKHTDDAEKG